MLDHGHFTLVSTNSIPKNTTTTRSNMLATHSSTPCYDRSEPKIAALPSFSELLTSIPLPTSFKSRNNSNVSASSMNTSNSGSCVTLATMPAPQYQQQQQPQQPEVYWPSPYTCYSQPPVLHRLPTPPLHHHPLQNTPKQQYQYQYQVVGTNKTAFIAPQPVLSQRPSNIDPLTPVSASIETRVRSSSISEIPITPAIANFPTTSSYTQQHSYNQQTSPLQSSTSASSSATSPVLVNHVTKDSRRKHVCKVCARSFTTSGHLARHNRIHTGERKHKCPWPTCDARFARQDNCMQHYKTHTNGKNKRPRKYVSQGKYNGVSMNGGGVGMDGLPRMHPQMVPTQLPSVTHLTRYE